MDTNTTTTGSEAKNLSEVYYLLYYDDTLIMKDGVLNRWPSENASWRDATLHESIGEAMNHAKHLLGSYGIKARGLLMQFIKIRKMTVTAGEFVDVPEETSIERKPVERIAW